MQENKKIKAVNESQQNDEEKEVLTCRQFTIVGITISDFTLQRMMEESAQANDPHRS